MEEIIRWFERFLEENKLTHVALHMSKEAFKEYIQPRLSDIWDWITDNWDDIWSNILSVFGLG